MAPKNAAAFDFTLAKFCCVVDCGGAVPLDLAGDLRYKHIENKNTME